MEYGTIAVVVITAAVYAAVPVLAIRLFRRALS